MNSKKLQSINEYDGLQVVIHGGSDKVIVFQNDENYDYTLSFYKTNSAMPAYAVISATSKTLEGVMREYCSDLRKWHKISYTEC